MALTQVFGGLERARGMVTDLPPQWREAAAARLGGGRVFGTSALPGHFAALLLLAAPLVDRTRVAFRALAAGGWSDLLALIAVAMVLTRSLAAPAIAAVLLVPLAAGKVRSRLVQVGAGVVLAVAVAVVASRHDLGSLEPIRLRWVNWQTTGWVFGQHPLARGGAGGVGQAGLLAPTAAANITPYAHNTYLQLLAELGIAGVGLLAAGVWALLRLIRTGLAAHPGLTLAVATIPLHNVVDFSAYAPEVLLPWAVLAGTLAGRGLPLPERPLRGSMVLTLAGIGALLSTLAWRGEVELASAAAPPPARAVEIGTGGRPLGTVGGHAGGVRGQPRPRKRRACGGRLGGGRLVGRASLGETALGELGGEPLPASAGPGTPGGGARVGTRGAPAGALAGGSGGAGGRVLAPPLKCLPVLLVPVALAWVLAPSARDTLTLGVGGDGRWWCPGSASPEPEGARSGPARGRGWRGSWCGLPSMRRSDPLRPATRRACSRPGSWRWGWWS